MDPISSTKPKLYTPVEPEPQTGTTEKSKASTPKGPTGNPLMDAVAPPPSWGANVLQFYTNAMKPMPEQSSGTVPQTLVDKAKDPTFQAEACKKAVPFAAKTAVGYAGGQAGAYAGAEAGMMSSGPEGAVAGSLVGKVAGKKLGEEIGEKQGQKIAEKYCPKPPAQKTPPTPRWPTPQIAPPKGAPVACPVPQKTLPAMTPANAVMSNADGTES